MLGQQIITLVNGVKNAGYYKVNLNGSDLSSGIYLYRLETNEKTLTRKMMLIK